jgi:hypothetical protein
MVMTDPTLKEIFYSLQEQMKQRLSDGRKIIVHPTAMGDASEINWIEWLKTYLPKRYQIDKAFVIDSNNKFSEQIDLVIYDNQYSPFVFHQNDAIYIPAESVYAVFEVKQDINKDTLTYAGNKIKSVRLLSRTSSTIVHAGGVISKPKPPFRIYGGILSTTCQWVDTFGKPFQDCLNSFDDYSQVDIGCIIDTAGFTIDYIPAISFKVSTKDEALIFFFLKLLVNLQNLGTVPAMDIEAYARALDSL